LILRKIIKIFATTATRCHISRLKWTEALPQSPLEELPRSPSWISWVLTLKEREEKEGATLAIPKFDYNAADENGVYLTGVDEKWTVKQRNMR